MMKPSDFVEALNERNALQEELAHHRREADRVLSESRAVNDKLVQTLAEVAVLPVDQLAAWLDQFSSERGRLR